MRAEILAIPAHVVIAAAHVTVHVSAAHHAAAAAHGAGHGLEARFRGHLVAELRSGAAKLGGKLRHFPGQSADALRLGIGVARKGIQFQAWGSLLGQLLLRSIDRAQLVYESMQLRGFAGSFPPGQKKHGGWLFLAVTVFYCAVFRAVPVFELAGRLL